MRNWDETGQVLNRGPRAATGLIVGWIIALIFIVTGIGIVGKFAGWFGSAAQVVAEQVDPRALLAKYEWFKDAAAQLDALHANINVYDQRRKSIELAYDGQKRSAWTRDDRQEWDQSYSEVAGVKAAYNTLAADYNARMAKINYAFTNVGGVPQGAAPLPREFRTYEVN